MEEYQGYETSGEFEQSAAETEYSEETTTETTEQDEVSEESAETGEEEAAAEQGEEEQPEQVEAQPNDKVEKAFAKRLAAERQKIESEYRQQMEQQFQQLSPLMQLAQTEARKYGMNPIQWAQAVMQNQEQAYYRQLEEQGVDPRIIDQHPAVLQAKQMQEALKGKEQQLSEKERFNQEAQELFETFPDVDAKNIPQEVWQLRDQKGLSLLDAYLRVNHKKMIEDTKAKTEQQTIANLRKKKEASTGPTTGGAATTKTAWDLSDKDFDKMYERAMRGEKFKF